MPDTIQCPNCGTPNDTGAALCKACMNPLTAYSGQLKGETYQGRLVKQVAYLDTRPETDKRGVIGIGEPVAVGVVAAIANAVANAIGVRVPGVPLTPPRVLAALEGRTYA